MIILKPGLKSFATVCIKNRPKSTFSQSVDDQQLDNKHINLTNKEINKQTCVVTITIEVEFYFFPIF